MPFSRGWSTRQLRDERTRFRETRPATVGDARHFAGRCARESSRIGDERFSLDTGRLSVSNKRRECRLSGFRRGPPQPRAREKTNHVESLAAAIVALGLTLMARADGPADNRVDKVRPVPPPGINLADADRKALQDGVDELGKQIDALRDSLKAKPSLAGPVAGRADL